MTDPFMPEFGLTKFQRSPSMVCDCALQGAVAITRYGQRCLVLLSVEDYLDLKMMEQLNSINSEDAIATKLDDAPEEVRKQLLEGCNDILGIDGDEDGRVHVHRPKPR